MLFCVSICSTCLILSLSHIWFLWQEICWTSIASTLAPWVGSLPSLTSLPEMTVVLKMSSLKSKATKYIPKWSGKLGSIECNGFLQRNRKDESILRRRLLPLCPNVTKSMWRLTRRTLLCPQWDLGVQEDRYAMFHCCAVDGRSCIFVCIRLTMFFLVFVIIHVSECQQSRNRGRLDPQTNRYPYQMHPGTIAIEK